MSAHVVIIGGGITGIAAMDHLSTQAPIQIVSAYWLVERSGGELRAGGNGDDVLDLFWVDLARLPLDEMFPADREFALRLPALL